jgi:hypothetical protein
MQDRFPTEFLKDLLYNVINLQVAKAYFFSTFSRVSRINKNSATYVLKFMINVQMLANKFERGNCKSLQNQIKFFALRDVLIYL